MNAAERQQSELERQEELLRDLYYLFEFCGGVRTFDAAINVAAALGLSNEFKRMIGG